MTQKGRSMRRIARQCRRNYDPPPRGLSKGSKFDLWVKFAVKLCKDNGLR